MRPASLCTAWCLPVYACPEPCNPLQAELSNETNLFFHYTSCLTPEQFEGVQQRQGLMVDFAAFPSVLISCLDECVRQPHTHFCYLELHPDGEADLSFIQASRIFWLRMSGTLLAGLVRPLTAAS